MRIENVALLGAGAVGAYFIWGMSENLGVHFQVLADGDRKKRLEQNGLIINDKKYKLNVRTPEEAETPDLLLVCTKYDTLDDAIDVIQKVVGPKTIVLSLLNGVNSEERIGKAIGMEHMIYSSMWIASVRNENGITFSPKHTAGVFVGEKDCQEPTERVKAIQELFEQNQIGFHFAEDIMEHMWHKYASNIAQNLPQAILGVGHGAYKDSEHVAYIAGKLWKEVVAVAAKKGVCLPPEPVLFRGVRPMARFSTLQDLDAKRHTEIQMFAGEMMRMGEEVGVPVPYCEYTYHAIRALEEKNDGKFVYVNKKK